MERRHRARDGSSRPSGPGGGAPRVPPDRETEAPLRPRLDDRRLAAHSRPPCRRNPDRGRTGNGRRLLAQAQARLMRLERITADEAERLQTRIAGALVARGIQAGDRVAFICPNSVELLCGILGAARVGIAPVPLNPALLDEERNVILDDADPALIVGPSELAGLVDGPPAELAPAPLVRPMHYTSGTTGTPKGVWSGLLDERDAVALQDDESDVWAFEGDDVLLVCSPLYHSAPPRGSSPSARRRTGKSIPALWAGPVRGAASKSTTTASSGATPRPSPVSPIGATRNARWRPGGAVPSPPATSDTSKTTSCSSTAAATTSSSPAA